MNNLFESVLSGMSCAIFLSQGHLWTMEVSNSDLLCVNYIVNFRSDAITFLLALLFC